MVVSSKYFGNFWKTLEILPINWEVNLMLTWSANCVISSTAAANQAATFAISKTKLYVPVVTKKGIKRSINWN